MMDTLTASSVSSRPWVLQFFRNLFGNRHAAHEGQGAKADANEKQDVKSELLESPLSDTQAKLPCTALTTTSFSNAIHDGVISNHTEELAGQLKEISLGEINPVKEKRLSALLDPAGLEMGDSDGFTDPMMNNLAQDSCEMFSVSREKEESSGDRGTVGKDGISQIPCVDDGVSMAAGSMAGAEESSVEEEREHLLKEDVRIEPPKAEVSPWNRLLNLYKQRRRLPAAKLTRLQDVPAQPEIQDEATLDLMIYGFATPKPHVTLSNSPACICGLPENESGELVAHCETAQEDIRTGNLEHPQNMF